MRLSIFVPDEVVAEIRALNGEEPMGDVLRRYLKVGLLCDKLHAEGVPVVIREATGDRELVVKP